MVASWSAVRLSVLTMIIALLASPASATTHAVFDPTEEEAIERIIRSYLLKKPEVLLDALKVLEDRQRVAKTEQTQQRIADNRDALLSDPGSPVGGNPDGDVTIVEFFDYRCPYCKAVAPRLAELLDGDDGIRFVYKEWPILGADSVTAARAALAAWKQDRYQEFHDRLMALAGQLDETMVFGHC